MHTPAFATIDWFIKGIYHHHVYPRLCSLPVNDAKSAAPCAASYMLFDPQDLVMQQNVAYYRFYQEQWGLEERHFLPQPVSRGAALPVVDL